MIKGEKIRFDIHKILISIYKFNRTLNSKSIREIIAKYKQSDVNLINNVTLNSMRYQYHVTKIINLYVKRKLRDQERILLLSAITQIVYLDFKDYAVINCSVEIAKKLKIYHGFVNATLKNISKNKKKLTKIKIFYDDLPKWFIERTKNISKIDKKKFIINFNQESSLHIVFKNNIEMNNFEEEIIKTSDTSGFLISKKNPKDVESYNKGVWWIQDFASFFPLYNFDGNNKFENYLDACAAPGGKAFQILSKKIKITLNDKSSSRIKILKSNLKRLKFEAKILNEDFINFKFKERFDVIILDAPCSSVGTIRKNPEIFFKNNEPDFRNLLHIQEEMLLKGAHLLKSNGIILYMVCSFLKIETDDQINKFLKKNNNFELYDFKLINGESKYSKLINDKCMKTLPTSFLNNNIDGYFAAFLKKNK